MLLPALVAFALCVALSAFFAGSETAFIASSPYSLEHYERKGSRRAGIVRGILTRINDFLVTILIGNTLVNVAAASIATSIFVTLIPEKNKAVLLATIATTLLILVFGEINPKTFAAHNPVRTAIFVSYPIKGLMVLLYPLVKVFSFITGLIMPSSRGLGGRFRHLDEEELRIAILAGARGLSALRRKIVAGALDIGARPVKEIIVPRPQVKAIDADAAPEEILRTIQASGFSRYPVFRGRLDNIEGLVRTKDILGYLIDNKEIDLKGIIRKPLFVPELASLEKVMLQMQAQAVHMAFVVDEFGNVDGIVTLEDILEEIVGDIRDEREGKAEDPVQRLEDGAWLIKGATPVKEANARLALGIPEKMDYTTMAGFFLSEFGRIPGEGESLEFGGRRLTVEKMNKRHISLLRLDRVPGKDSPVS